MDIEDSITQFEEVFENTPWYGQSILKSLETIPKKFWDARLEHASHTITELVWHIIDWRIFVIEKIKGNELYSIEMNSAKDWRENTAVKGQKEEIIEALKKTQNTIITLLNNKPDSWMSDFVEGKDYKNEYMIAGAIQHDIYHIGQINFLYTQLKKEQVLIDKQ